MSAEAIHPLITVEELEDRFWQQQGKDPRLCFGALYRATGHPDWPPVAYYEDFGACYAWDEAALLRARDHARRIGLAQATRLLTAEAVAAYRAKEGARHEP